ncbi:hypothetical protein PRELSG_0400200 [Plasmodium relictum]|uniref:Uncharacterized protein n=1 Tax=Plasmodium relictum TaxID=85471 RepID=A0A1J1H1L2_PLARL|nr:hypothetical protein PRELSG_0400200 [Plasmodium relictum]CRG98654.1 hypothetical protein PRELSG_0400200 [Plasmodium relictum]
MQELNSTSSNITNITRNMGSIQQHMCTVTTQVCNLAEQVCNSTLQMFNNTDNNLNNTNHAYTTQMCNSTTHLCNNALQLCNGTSDSTVYHHKKSVNSMERLALDFFIIWLIKCRSQNELTSRVANGQYELRIKGSSNYVDTLIIEDEETNNSWNNRTRSIKRNRK